jgi:hypothetical protein
MKIKNFKIKQNYDFVKRKTKNIDMTKDIINSCKK